ncbi:Helix-turn-helix domain protein (plasmid) [Caballeronia sp. SBC1]|nr:Helix-turn-helix domain protein [Caballeronia sp. SBC2]QIN65154.1 Helix-turn-helix domain protein [Caballeronia sp. SBC1]
MNSGGTPERECGSCLLRRQQAQLSQALELLAHGHAVAEVADALGYATPSSFIFMFRRALGDSPASYFAKRARSQ